jgi:hypothetical protein
LLQAAQPLQQVGRHRTVRAGLDQGVEKLIGILLGFEPMAGLGRDPDLGSRLDSSGGTRRSGKFLGQAAAEGLQAFAAAGIETHGGRGAVGEGKGV